MSIRNTSGETAFPGNISPGTWAVHDGSEAFFDIGAPASAGIERLAESGNGTALVAALNDSAAVASAGIAGAGPLAPGSALTFTVTPDVNHRYFNVAAMIAPSNDTFLALGATGVALLDETGARRAEADIAADVAAALMAWDAGTEANQSGAAGRDQPPRQSDPDAGASEGNGLVRRMDDPVWSYAPASELVRVFIIPVQ